MNATIGTSKGDVPQSKGSSIWDGASPARVGAAAPRPRVLRGQRARLQKASQVGSGSKGLEGPLLSILCQEGQGHFGGLEAAVVITEKTLLE